MEPPGPEAVSSKVLGPIIGMVRDPESSTSPIPWSMKTLVAPVVLQLSVITPPSGTCVALELKVT